MAKIDVQVDAYLVMINKHALNHKISWKFSLEIKFLLEKKN